MGKHRHLDVPDAAEALAAEVVKLIDETPRMLYKAQLRDSIQGISANIAEAFGRGTKADRNRVLVIARAESEESIRHLRTNFNAERIFDRDYWRHHNRLVTIVKMLNGLMR
ncbi:MAG TPA: four helix bundle protein [Gemmatimonadaceae bacterium]